MVRLLSTAGGYLSQSSKVVHFGLGHADRIDEVEIHWPGGRRQVVAHPAVNRRHDLLEPDDP
jgi:hypothetical protein